MTQSKSFVQSPEDEFGFIYTRNKIFDYCFIVISGQLDNIKLDLIRNITGEIGIDYEKTIQIDGKSVCLRYIKKIAKIRNVDVLDNRGRQVAVTYGIITTNKINVASIDLYIERLENDCKGKLEEFWRSLARDSFAPISWPLSNTARISDIPDSEIDLRSTNHEESSQEIDEIAMSRVQNEILAPQPANQSKSTEHQPQSINKIKPSHQKMFYVISILVSLFANILFIFLLNNALEELSRERVIAHKLEERLRILSKSHPEEKMRFER